jgi:hypothetical protein
MKNRRRIGFLLAILVGLAIGLIFGWVINPPAAQNTRLSGLRSDYQADYVLMVAEKYASDQDAVAARESLKKISPSDPLESIQQALVLAQQLNYSEQELQTITVLQSGLSAAVTP